LLWAVRCLAALQPSRRAKAPLVYEVKMSDDGKIAELKLVRTAGGEVLAIGYPYGRPSLA